MDVATLLATQVALPSIPRVIALLLSELGRQQPDLKRITQLISTDPVLTARLLQFANSGFFKLSQQIHSVSEALAVVGLVHVRAMVVGAASSSSPKAVPGIYLPQFWTYSLNVAKVARSLAGVVRQNQQAAFTCGLLHAIGALTMHAVMPEQMAALDSELGPFDIKRGKAEIKQFGFCYAQVSAEFARKWLLPAAMVDALEHQIAPFANHVYEPLAGVIHLATWRARAREAALSEREMAVSFPGMVGEVLALDIDMVLQQDPIDWGAQGE